MLSPSRTPARWLRILELMQRPLPLTPLASLLAMSTRLDLLPAALHGLVHDALSGTQLHWKQRFSQVIAPLDGLLDRFVAEMVDSDQWEECDTESGTVSFFYDAFFNRWRDTLFLDEMQKLRVRRKPTIWALKDEMLTFFELRHLRYYSDETLAASPWSLSNLARLRKGRLEDAARKARDRKTLEYARPMRLVGSRIDVFGGECTAPREAPDDLTFDELMAAASRHRNQRDFAQIMVFYLVERDGTQLERLKAAIAREEGDRQPNPFQQRSTYPEVMQMVNWARQTEQAEREGRLPELDAQRAADLARNTAEWERERAGTTELLSFASRMEE